MSKTIQESLDDQKELVGEVGKGLLNGNGESVAKSLFGLAVGVASSSPALGVLGSEIVGKIFSTSAAKKLEQAIADAKSDEDRRRFVREISSAIEALLGEFLIQVVRTHHQVTDELTKRLGGNASLQQYGRDVAEELRNCALLVAQIDVSNGALGVEVSVGARQAVIGSIRASGAGSVAVKI